MRGLDPHYPHKLFKLFIMVVKEEELVEIYLNGKLVKTSKKVKLLIEGEHFPAFF